MSEREQPAAAAESNSGAVARGYQAGLWLSLLAAGFGLEFVGRFFGLRDNPSGIWLEEAPLFTTVCAALLVLYAAFRLMNAWTLRDLRAFRQALLLLLLGLAMVMASMISKSLVAMIFVG
ncbi:MAG: hypothetical protein FWC59_02770 [Actinomycetia bacterium]|nr:hypothetical protein [Actinomycetes bacterium]